MRTKDQGCRSSVPICPIYRCGRILRNFCACLYICSSEMGGWPGLLHKYGISSNSLYQHRIFFGNCRSVPKTSWTHTTLHSLLVLLSWRKQNAFCRVEAIFVLHTQKVIYWRLPKTFGPTSYSGKLFIPSFTGSSFYVYN